MLADARAAVLVVIGGGAAGRCRAGRGAGGGGWMTRGWRRRCGGGCRPRWPGRGLVAGNAGVCDLHVGVDGGAEGGGGRRMRGWWSCWRRAAGGFAVGPGDAGAAFASLAFDASVWELCGGAGCGRAAGGGAGGGAAGRAELAGLAERQRVTVVRRCRRRCAGGAGGRVPRGAGGAAGGWCWAGRRWTAGGWRRGWCGRRRPVVVNVYGPTETTVCATLHAAGRGGRGAARCRSGGRCANTRVFVLDGWLGPVPAGGGGGAVCGGGGAGAGLPGPAGADGGAVRGVPVRGGGERMYRTGDLARWTRGRAAGVRRAGLMSR